MKLPKGLGCTPKFAKAEKFHSSSEETAPTSFQADTRPLCEEGEHLYGALISALAHLRVGAFGTFLMKRPPKTL